MLAASRESVSGYQGPSRQFDIDSCAISYLVNRLAADRESGIRAAAYQIFCGSSTRAIVCQPDLQTGRSSEIQIDREIDPIACWRYFKLAIVANVGPIVAEKHLDHVLVPEAYMWSIVVGRQKQIQNGVGAAKQQIDIGIGPERSYFSLRFG